MNESDARSGAADACGARPALCRWEAVAPVLAVCVTVALGLAHLGVPSLWHDEAVHVFVAQRIAETGRAELPSGHFYSSGLAFNYILAGVISLFGDSETAVRAPSVVFAAMAVLLTYLVTRALLGRPTAAVAAFALALSPWTVAWSREARFYALLQACYVAAIGTAWCAVSCKTFRGRMWFGAATLGTYFLGVFSGFQGILFVAPIGAYGCLMGGYERRRRRYWLCLSAVAGLVGLATFLTYRFALPEGDLKAIFDRGGLGGRLTEPNRAVRQFYLLWLWQNLGAGFFLAAVLGFCAMVIREKRRGLFAALAFLAPLFVLTYLYGYRRERFIHFAFPFWVAAFSYGLVQLVRVAARARRSWLHALLAVAVTVFAARLCVSGARLIGDSLEAARGADLTLAQSHPQWRKPCRYVKERLEPDTVVIATAYLPALYYVGRVDNWFPSILFQYEEWEVGSKGLSRAKDLEQFVKTHPKGYFIADQQRLGAHPRHLADECAWVAAHMRRVDEACSADVDVYSWGMDRIATEAD